MTNNICGNTFENKVALITGGSRGLGADLCQSLRAHGCKVIVMAREPDPEQCDIALTCDVSDEHAVNEAFAKLQQQVEQLDYAFINAGVSGFAPILDMETEEWDRVININLRGAFLCLRETARFMKAAIEKDKQSSGSIITCCSLASFAPEPNIAHYGAAKAGLAMLTKTAAKELGQYNIRVNGIAPGLTKTDIIAGSELIPDFHERVAKRTPLGRLGESNDITNTLFGLFTMEWVSGEILKADGGLSLFTGTDPMET